MTRSAECAVTKFSGFFNESQRHAGQSAQQRADLSDIQPSKGAEFEELKRSVRRPDSQGLEDPIFLISHGSFEPHAPCLAVDDEAVAFCEARVASLWRRKLGEDDHVFSLFQHSAFTEKRLIRQTEER